MLLLLILCFSSMWTTWGMSTGYNRDYYGRSYQDQYNNDYNNERNGYNRGSNGAYLSSYSPSTSLQSLSSFLQLKRQTESIRPVLVPSTSSCECPPGYERRPSPLGEDWCYCTPVTTPASQTVGRCPPGYEFWLDECQQMTNWNARNARTYAVRIRQ